MGADHRLEKGRLALHEEPKARQSIEKLAKQNPAPNPWALVILEQEVEVVSEIEEGLVGALLLQGASTEMVNVGFRSDPHHQSPVLQAPAQVDFLHVGEEVLVKTAHSPPRFRPDQQAGPGSPEHCAGRVVLTVVDFLLIKQPSGTKHEAMAVHVATSRTGIFEFRPPFHRTNLGLCRRPSFGFRCSHQAI